MDKYIVYKIKGMVIYCVDDVQGINNILDRINKEGVAEIDDVELVEAKSLDEAYAKVGG